MEINQVQRQVEGGLSLNFQKAFEAKIFRLRNKKEEIFQHIQE